MRDAPVLDRRGFRGDVVVEPEVCGELTGHFVVNALKELRELVRPVVVLTEITVSETTLNEANRLVVPAPT